MTSISIVVLGAKEPITFLSSAGPLTGTPLTFVIKSPSFKPAFSAAESESI